LIAILFFFHIQAVPWLVHLSAKILNGDPIVNEILDPDHGNPFFNNDPVTSRKSGKKQQPPRFVRAMLYEVSRRFFSFDFFKVIWFC
jgi:hypothetical protein